MKAKTKHRKSYREFSIFLRFVFLGGLYWKIYGTYHKNAAVGNLYFSKNPSSEENGFSVPVRLQRLSIPILLRFPLRFLLFISERGKKEVKTKLTVLRSFYVLF